MKELIEHATNTIMRNMKRERRRVESKNLLVEEKIEKKDLTENVVDGEQRLPEDAAITRDAENARNETTNTGDASSAAVEQQREEQR